MLDGDKKARGREKEPTLPSCEPYELQQWLAWQDIPLAH